MDNKSHDKRFLAYGIYIMALLIFGTNGIFASHISLASSQIVLLRTFIGGIMLTCLVLFCGGFDKDRVQREWMPILLGGVALGLNWITLFEAYRVLNVSLATLIYYVGPILVLLFSPIFFREKLTGRKLISVIIVASGLLCISGSIVVTGMNTWGLVFAVISAILYAALIVINKQISHTSGLQTAAIELDVAFVVVLVYTLCTLGFPYLKGNDLPYIAAIGFINTGLAYLLYFSGLQKLSGQSVALISYLDPVSALLFSAFLLHEVMTPVQIVGAVLIIGGAMFGEIKKQRE
ncbi:EamA family transporter [Ruminococcus sp. AF18-22]|jgi:drug/metabolite transporter (DMT)-like permease|nr:EamA family transporter [Ruminococcus sp. AF18-22]